MGYQFTIGDQVSTATVEINGSYRGFLEALKQADAELIGT